MKTIGDILKNGYNSYIAPKKSVGRKEEQLLKPGEYSGELNKQGYKIKNVIAYITPESSLGLARKLFDFNEVITFPYNEFRNPNSKVFTTFHSLIRKYSSSTNLILDTTPLTKLFTLKLLQLSIQYQIPSFYYGKTNYDTNQLIWTYRPLSKYILFKDKKKENFQ